MASEYGAGSDPTTLKAEGFKEFATVGTGGPSGEQGGSFALELGSPSAAVREQAASLATARQGQGGAKLVPFTVPGVPGSTGIHALGSQSTSNVYWHEGTCVAVGGRHRFVGSRDRRSAGDLGGDARAQGRVRGVAAAVDERSPQEGSDR